MIKSLSKLARSPLINEGDKADRLTKIASNLRTDKLSCGVVGLSKAGKSTTLNALLGCDFLPTSSQVETAVNVAIFHKPNAPEGILYMVNNGRLEQIQTGCREIREYLYKVNNDARAGTIVPPRLVLHVPILLLEGGLNSVNVTLADTPGLSEATVKNSTIIASGYGALKDMFAFILIMNLEYLKSEAEVNLLRELVIYHPEILKKLDRILILVNRYEATFRNNYSKSLKPENISKYVSDYLAEPRVLNVRIPPEHILPYSAFWGLKSRMWSLNSSIMTEDDYFNYEDAIDILLKAGVIEEHETDPIDRDSVLAKLMIFSKLQLVENEIRRMLQLQGPKILLKAAVDDSRGILLHINDTIIERKKELETELSLKRRLNLVKLTNIAESSREVKGVIDTLRQSYSSQLGSETVSLQESLERHVEAGIRDYVSDLKWVEGLDKLKSRLIGLKPEIINVAHNKLKKSWMNMMNVLHSIYLNNIEKFRSRLKTTHRQLLECTTDEETKIMLETNISLLESSTSASPSSHTMYFVPTADYIDLTRRIDEKRQVRWITKYYTKTTNCGFLWLNRKTKTISYDVSESYMVYAADERSLKADFYPFISEWVNLWKNKLNEAIGSSIQVLYDKTNRIEQATQAVRSEINKEESEMNMKLEKLKNAQRNIDEILTQLNEQ